MKMLKNSYHESLIWKCEINHLRIRVFIWDQKIVTRSRNDIFVFPVDTKINFDSKNELIVNNINKSKSKFKYITLRIC